MAKRSRVAHVVGAGRRGSESTGEAKATEDHDNGFEEAVFHGSEAARKEGIASSHLARLMEPLAGVIFS